jgi:hypothetical protein
LKRSQNAFFGDFSSFRPFFSINRYGESNDIDVFVDYYFKNVDNYSENIDHRFEETVDDSIEIDDATEINVDYTEIDIEIVYESVHIENIDQSSEDHDDEIYDQIIDARATLVGSVHRW